MDSSPLGSDQTTNTIMGTRPAVETVGQIDVNRNDDDLEGPPAYQWDSDSEDERAEEGAEVTLSTFTETGQEESSIEVPKQRLYTGRRPVIPCSLADTPCTKLGIQGVLDRLNATLGKPEVSHGLHTMIEGFIERNDDFGTAYGRLRTVWNQPRPHRELCRREKKDRERRQKALVGNQIVSPDLPPRRVWDLYSNRVVPFWVVHKNFSKNFMKAWLTPISHVWVDEKEHVDVGTPINGKEWPVPIPRDADLNLIRIEMLNLGKEYAWLDVLCLRQKWGPREDLRMEEWRLDVPTIGRVYEGAYDVVIYLSGLRRPLRLKDGDLDSDRCWFRRAWTLQEVTWKHIIAGDTPDGPMHEPIDDNGNYETPLLTRFHKQWYSLKRSQLTVFGVVADMKERVSTNPVDRVAGLAFPLYPKAIPAYNESETLEDAWTALVNAMDPNMCAHFLLLYPGVGLGCKKWRPTWDQVMTEPLPKDEYFGQFVEHDNERDEDWYYGCCIEKGCVRGLNAGSAKGHDRCGELVIDGLIPHTFKIHVTHQIPIPEDTYTLLGDLWSHAHWAVGRRLPDQRFEKVSVIVMDGDKDEIREKLKDLHLDPFSGTLLI